MATDRHTLALWISSVCCVLFFALAGYVLLFVILPDALHSSEIVVKRGWLRSRAS
jgi:hypothetical protein